MRLNILDIANDTLVVGGHQAITAKGIDVFTILAGWLHVGGYLESVDRHFASGFDVDEPVTEPVTLRTEVVNLGLGGMRQFINQVAAPLG
jgi:hypothetical protein